jgi:hypothetical protein
MSSLDSFSASGSSPTSDLASDFRCENHGSIFLLYPLTESAKSWIEENLPSDAQWFGQAVPIEHRTSGRFLKVSKTMDWS